MINSLIFPVPSCSYTNQSHHGALIHIPRKNTGTFTFGLWIPYISHASRNQQYAKGSADEFVIIYSHPNAVDIGMMYEEMEYLSRSVRASVLLYEYRGYGMCEGTPEEEELNFDIESVYFFVTETLRYPPSRVILMGRSIGTGPSTRLAASALCRDNPPAGLVLQAPFTSIKDCVKTVAKRMVGGLEDFASYFVADRFRNVDIIHQVSCPVAIQHGDLDTIVDYAHSQKLVGAAQAKGKQDVTLHTAVGYGHNDLSVSEAAVIIRNIIIQAIAASSSATAVARPLTSVAVDRRWLVLPTLHDEWFPSTCLTLGQLEDHWIRTISLTHLLYQRATLSRLWSLGIAHLTMRCGVAWQRLNSIWEADHLEQTNVYVATNGRSGSRPSPYKPPYTITHLVQQCLAVWGSPLGVYYEVRMNAPQQPAAVFHKIFSTLVTENANICAGETAGRACPLVLRRGSAGSGSSAASFLTVLEYELPRRVLQAMCDEISASPPLFTDRTTDETCARAFIRKSTFDLISLEMQRMIAVMPDAEWAAMQHLILNFFTPHVVLKNVSDQARAECAAVVLQSSPGHRGRRGTSPDQQQQEDPTNGFDGSRPLAGLGISALSIPEIQQIISHHATAGIAADAAASASVPWDMLLLHARSCVSSDGVIATIAADGSVALSADPSWPLVAHLQQIFVASAGSGGDAVQRHQVVPVKYLLREQAPQIAQPVVVTSAPSKSSDGDCSIC